MVDQVSGKIDRVDLRYDAYLALLDYRIRNAWVSPPVSDKAHMRSNNGR